MINDLHYLKTNESGVWTYPVIACEREWELLGMDGFDNQPLSFVRVMARALAKIGLIRNLRKRSQFRYLAVLMGPAEYRMFPVSYCNDVIVYCYDCWPPSYQRWESLLRRNRIELAFFSARQSAQHFAQRLPQMRSIWLPEATDPTIYDGSRTLAERSIDVLELGRRYDAFHNSVVDALRGQQRVHLYEQRKGEIIFSTKSELVVGLGNSKISICFPGSLTDHARCGEVETMTHRYLESIASKCIVLGRCPRELADLFGYNPVVEVDLNDPVKQLEDILSHLDEFTEFVDRNYRRLLEVGTWEVRAQQMMESIMQK